MYMNFPEMEDSIGSVVMEVLSHRDKTSLLYIIGYLEQNNHKCIVQKNFLFRISWTARVRVGKYSRRMQEYNGACYQVNKKNAALAQMRARLLAITSGRCWVRVWITKRFSRDVKIMVPITASDRTSR